jgi:hypothetical protein
MRITTVRQQPVKMNDKAVQAIVRKYIVNLQLRHASYADADKDTVTEERRK